MPGSTNPFLLVFFGVFLVARSPDASGGDGPASHEEQESEEESGSDDAEDTEADAAAKTKEDELAALQAKLRAMVPQQFRHH